MINYNFYYWGPLLFNTHIKKENLNKIKKLCKKNIKKSHVKNLAGDIKHEYTIDKNSLNKILMPYMETFRHAYKQWYNNTLSEITVSAAWVNYMQPGDYNPVHIHRNCEFSGVIYIDIPKKLQKEISEYKGTVEGPGTIAFMYGEDAGHCQTMKNFVPATGDFYMFPYMLRHSVNPHKSNCERISIGVNFNIKGEK